tara:strand:+ start:44 stop:154 length:111 start_codon:yes stop_codon:yes gene_type:complete
MSKENPGKQAKRTLKEKRNDKRKKQRADKGSVSGIK